MIRREKEMPKMTSCQFPSWKPVLSDVVSWELEIRVATNPSPVLTLSVHVE